MSAWLLILISLGYLGTLFGVALMAERHEKKGKSWVNNPYVYSLSLAVYCTAWTFYGSVGRATSAGAGFLPVYLGPTMAILLWGIVLRKTIAISRHQRITSIADFISSRYGKSTVLGILVTVMAVAGIVPYIALQLKGISMGFEVMTSTSSEHPSGHFLFTDTTLYVTVIMALFTIWFGTRHLDANEHHEGLIAAIAFESVLKLLVFLVAGVYVVFIMFNGPGEIFEQALKQGGMEQLFTLGQPVSQTSWFSIGLISMFAILMLPRQFHVSVVENTQIGHIWKAMWLFPLYMFIINFFILPIAAAGLLLFTPSDGPADMVMLRLPLYGGHYFLALLVYIGGLAAATGMIITETTALSIMVSNNFVLPLLASSGNLERSDRELPVRLINIRRLAILGLLLTAYLYFRAAGSQALVSIGLISFAGVAQFAPAFLGGLYWKRATKSGALAGLMAGFAIWIYTLLLPNLAESGILSNDFVQHGILGISWLKPYELFGLSGFDHLSHAVFWSLFFNVVFYFGVSIYTLPSLIEHMQADVFVNIEKYSDNLSSQDVLKRQASFSDLRHILNRILGPKRTREVLMDYSKRKKIRLDTLKNADEDLINYAESILAGSIGTASARIIVSSVVSEEAVSLEELMRVLDQTREIMSYSQSLEEKSNELERTTNELRQANERLRDLDNLKNNFITTVTHELRTPITSIKAMSRLMLDFDQMSPEKKSEFLGIIVSESERLARLVNQVLDVEKLNSDNAPWKKTAFDLGPLLGRTTAGVEHLFREKGVALELTLPQGETWLHGDEDRMTQVVVNLLSNALKFTSPLSGKVHLQLNRHGNRAILSCSDNGPGIPEDKRQLVFDRFTQLNQASSGKPQGSGLGLYITKNIVERHNGEISVQESASGGAEFLVSIPLRDHLQDIDN